MKTKYGFQTSKKRSQLMSKIGSKDTTPEIILRKSLWKHGIRYRLYDKSLPGKPDIVIKKYKLAIFVDGEFWHGYNWEEKKNKIKANREYWIPKIEKNLARDSENNQELEYIGYTVFRFWEKEIKNNLEICIQKIINYINEKK